MDTCENIRHFDYELIASRLKEARSEIEALSDGRSVKLLAVTKTVPVEVINYAIDELGVDAIGENRVQELLSKYESLHKPKSGKLDIHLIGSLQTNKVKYIIDKVDMIESVDSLKLAAEIDRQAKKHSLTMDILIEVNSGREEQKGGVDPDELEAFVKTLGEYTNLCPRGLMTIAPVCINKDGYLKYFGETRDLFWHIKSLGLDHIKEDRWNVLSMGMSGSYPEAIRAGSTEIRLGSTIFGARIYPETLKNENK